MKALTAAIIFSVLILSACTQQSIIHHAYEKKTDGVTRSYPASPEKCWAAVDAILQEAHAEIDESERLPSGAGHVLAYIGRAPAGERVLKSSLLGPWSSAEGVIVGVWVEPAAEGATVYMVSKRNHWSSDNAMSEDDFFARFEKKISD